MSTTVTAGSMTVTSTSSSADEMVEALAPEDQEKDEPRVIIDKGKPVKDGEPKDETTKAASVLGKKGGEAAAKARAKAAKEAKAEGDELEPTKAKADDDEPSADEGKDHRGNPRHDPKARVQQATREAKEAREAAQRQEAENRELRARLDRIERAQQPPTRPNGEDRGQPDPRQPQPGQPKPKPRSEDFETYEQYLDARDNWNREQWTRETARQQHAHAIGARAHHEATQAISGWEAAQRKAAEHDPEFEDRVAPVKEQIGIPSRFLPPGTQPNAWNFIADDLFSQPELAPALMLHLAEHPDELQRLATLSSPRAITRELAKIGERLDAATAGTSSRREQSKAKPPVAPVAGSPNADPGELDENASLSAFVHRHGQRELRSQRR